MNPLKTAITAVALSFALIACADDDSPLFCTPEIDPLCDFQKNFGSYDLGDTLAFKHSNGYEFKMVVTHDAVHYRVGFLDYPNESSIPCTSGESSPQATRMRDMILESDYPMLSILFTMDGDNSGAQNIKVEFGQNKFILDDTDFDDSSALVESMEINGTKYKNVAVINAMDKASQAKIYYTHKKGILKIDFGDGTYITRKELEGK